MRILGLSAFYHDSAAALVEDGRIVAAAQEERFTRKKHDSGFPHHALAYCLEAAGITLDGVDHVVFYDKPFLKFERLLETYLSFAPTGFRSFRMAIPVWLREKLFQKQLLRDELRKFSRDYDWENKLLFTEHHQSHAASAFFPSPFEEAAVLTMDGVGEWATMSVGFGRGNDLTILKELHFPHSLGLLYSAFTYYTGFKVNSGEYKVMGLAPYGEPKFAQLILDNIIDLKPDGTFWLDQSYFDYCTGLRMTNDKFDRLFGAPARKADELLTQRHMDLAASIQAVTEEIVLRLTRSLASETGAEHLCLAGGVALNCVANGKVLRDGKFKRIWIQPAAGDAGGALGAALAAYHIYKGGPRDIDNKLDGMNGAYLGPAFDDADSARRLAGGRRAFRASRRRRVDRPARQTTSRTARPWAGSRGGWNSARARSATGRSSRTDDRPTCSRRSISRSSTGSRSGRSHRRCCAATSPTGSRSMSDSPYMLLVADVVKRRQRSMSDAEQALFGIEKLNVPRSDIPAVTHVDYSARIQTVHAETNPRFHACSRLSKRKTGCPVLVNTSFNVRGEPIVHTPEDAFRCFMGTELDALAVGNLYLVKGDQDPSLKRDYKNAFELD